MKKIIVKDYNNEWPDLFNRSKSILLTHLSPLDVDIQHVGSTSVPGLPSKPILDIDIIVPDESVLLDTIKSLEGLGYVHVGNLGVEGRETFRQTKSIEGLEYPHHLYAGLRNSLGIRNHILFRDYLRNNLTKRNEYGILKMELAQLYENDIDLYIDGKTKFITNILLDCDMNHIELSKIIDSNKKK
ncbi:GrpB family protein [Mycoplasmatota bacterium]|nr:GrpB family protein [Mycoplasmatota bacterium]